MTDEHYAAWLQRKRQEVAAMSPKERRAKVEQIAREQRQADQHRRDKAEISRLKGKSQNDD